MIQLVYFIFPHVNAEYYSENIKCGFQKIFTESSNVKIVLRNGRIKIDQNIS